MGINPLEWWDEEDEAALNARIFQQDKRLDPALLQEQADTVAGEAASRTRNALEEQTRQDSLQFAETAAPDLAEWQRVEDNDEMDRALLAKGETEVPRPPRVTGTPGIPFEVGGPAAAERVGQVGSQDPGGISEARALPEIVQQQRPAPVPGVEPTDAGAVGQVMRDFGVPPYAAFDDQLGQRIFRGTSRAGEAFPDKVGQWLGNLAGVKTAPRSELVQDLYVDPDLKMAGPGYPDTPQEPAPEAVPWLEHDHRFQTNMANPNRGTLEKLGDVLEWGQNRWEQGMGAASGTHWGQVLVEVLTKGKPPVSGGDVYMTADQRRDHLDLVRATSQAIPDTLLGKLDETIGWTFFQDPKRRLGALRELRTAYGNYLRNVAHFADSQAAQRPGIPEDQRLETTLSESFATDIGIARQPAEELLAYSGDQLEADLQRITDKYGDAYAETVAAIAADPLNGVGWGLSAKVPLIGRHLVKIENAYILTGGLYM